MKHHRYWKLNTKWHRPVFSWISISGMSDLYSWYSRNGSSRGNWRRSRKGPLIFFEIITLKQRVFQQFSRPAKRTNWHFLNYEISSRGDTDAVLVELQGYLFSPDEAVSRKPLHEGFQRFRRTVRDFLKEDLEINGQMFHFPFCLCRSYSSLVCFRIL